MEEIILEPGTNREEKFVIKSVWHLPMCSHASAFEVYLPLVKLFKWEFLKYKQWVCPSCKTVGSEPWRGIIGSIGSAE